MARPRKYLRPSDYDRLEAMASVGANMRTIAVGDDPEALAIKVKLGGAKDDGHELLLGNGFGKFQAWCSEAFYAANRNSLLEAIGGVT